MYQNADELADAHVTKLLAILKTIGARGIRLDRSRLDEFNTMLDAKMAELQAQFDASEELKPLRGWHPKQPDGSFGYKKEPKSRTGLELRLFEWIGKDGIGYKETRWARRKPFLATSPKQVKEYLRSKGYRLPTNKDGDETSDGKGLLLLWRKHKDDLLKQIVDFRKLRKLRGTYGEWPLEQRGEEFYATTMFTLRPDTGRLSSVAPNVQNIPKRGALAKGFRRCLVSRMGHSLLRADLGSAEAIIIAWLSGDPLLMRLARLGMHKYAMAKKLGIGVDLGRSDEYLLAQFEELKHDYPELYNVVKTTVYGSFYLAGPRTLFEKNPEDFESTREARQFQSLVFGAIPQIQAWQRGVVEQRFLYGAQGRNWGWSGNRLINPFGFSKEFWDMRGSDGPAACAFLPQSTIASVVKECMLQLAASPLGKYMCWQIHDELVFDVPKELVVSGELAVSLVMGQPWPQLGGLQIPVEVKISEDMS